MPRIALGTFALFTVVAAGCAGSNPVAPTSVTAPQAATTAPAPVPTAGPPVPPAPTPSPAPSPAPAPPAAPAPGPSTVVYVATVSMVHWYTTPLFPSPTFTITRYTDHIHIEESGIDLPIVSQKAPLSGDFSAGDPKGQGLFNVIDGSMWTFSGGAGQGSGSLALR